MRSRFFYFCVLVFGLGLLTSCKTKKVTMASFADLYGEWQVVELNGKTIDPEKKHPVLNLDVARLELTGSTGCNRLMGKIEYSEDHTNIIRFLNVATTRRACLDMRLEQEFLEALNNVVRFQSVSESAPFTEIALYGADNSKLLEIKKQK